MSYASDALIDAQRNIINRLKTENENLRRAAERDADVMETLVSYIDDSRVDRLKAENEKLRELADAVKEFVEDTHCEICPCRHECDDNNHIFCNDFSYHAFAAMRDLGIEVER